MEVLRAAAADPRAFAREHFGKDADQMDVPPVTRLWMRSDKDGYAG